MSIEFTTESVAIIAITILVLASMSFLFLSSSTQFSSDREAKAYFATTCPQIRCGYDTSARLKEQFTKFYEACTYVLGPAVEEKPYQCLQQCGCDVSVSEEEVQENINEFVGILKKP